MQPFGFLHPGYEFVETYEHGLPSSREELARCVVDYVAFLLAESGLTHEPPVDVGAIITRFRLTVGSAELASTLPEIAGLAAAAVGIILSSDSDPESRRRYTQAHELLEFLIDALRGNPYSYGVRRYLQGWRKEQLCNWGAARLLMPLKSFHPRVVRSGLSVSAALSLRAEFHTSLTATLHHMVCSYPTKCGLIVWRHCLSPKEVERAAASNQQSLFGDRHRESLPKKMRVCWPVFGRAMEHLSPFQHESVGDDSIIRRAFDEGGGIWSAEEQISLSRLKGIFTVEATPVTWGDERRVLSLLHWPVQTDASIRAGAALHLV